VRKSSAFSLKGLFNRPGEGWFTWNTKRESRCPRGQGPEGKQVPGGRLGWPENRSRPAFGMRFELVKGVLLGRQHSRKPA
jgi:hypothetical protein